MKKIDNIDIAWTLQSIKGLGVMTQNKLLRHYGNMQQLYQSLCNDTVDLKDKMLLGLQHSLYQLNATSWEEKKAFYTTKHVKWVTIDDEDYPFLLKMIPDAPLVLYYKGTLPSNDYKQLSIIGTRKATKYGESIIESFLEKWSGMSMNIISGLAYGIDGYAHLYALKNNLPTYAVLGHGLQMISPVHHSRLAQRMIDAGGALITEFEWGTIPDKGNFPLRNRIVAGMSELVLVVETPKKGGSMITAQLANSYNREVAAVPGSLFQNNFVGNHFLIKNQMAHLVSNHEDILQLLGLHKRNQAPRYQQMNLYTQLTEEEKLVIDTLQKNGRLHIDDLVLQSNFNVSQLASILLNLELSGLIKTVPGKMYDLL